MSGTEKTKKKPAVLEFSETNGEDSLPILALEDYDVPEEEDEAVENTVGGSVRYAFVGSGQGGGRLAEAFYALGYNKSICVNTSPQDLYGIDLPEGQKILLKAGAGGAGKDMVAGEEALVKNQQHVYNAMKKIFGKHVDHLIICAGAGGGSGGGSLIPLIMIAKKYLQYCGYVEDVDSRVGVLMTLPTNGEATSVKVATNAYTLASKVSDLAESFSISPLLVLDNDRTQRLYGNSKKLTMKNFWPTLNTNVATLFDIFNRVSSKHSAYTSFDPADYLTIIKAGGHTIMGVTSIPPEKLNDETEVFKQLKESLSKTLLADGFDLTTATCASAIVVGGKDTFETVEGLPNIIDYAFDMLATMTGAATVHRGVYEDDRPGLRIYTIISGLKRPISRYRNLEALSVERYP